MLKSAMNVTITREKRFYLAAVALLFLGFFNDAWHTAPRERFYTQNRDMEAQVLCRLIMSRQNGLFFAAGLTGQGAADPGLPPVLLGPLDIFTTYVQNGRLALFAPYLSHSGGQAMMLSLLDRCLPMSPPHKLRFYYALVSLLSAATLAFVVLWIRRTAGIWAGWCALSGALFSSWLTVFGRNLWWFLGAFYLPFLVVAYLLGRQKDRLNPLVLGAFTGVFLKCFFTGFEFVTASLVMMLVPLVYYGVAEQWSTRKSLRIWSGVGLGAVAAVLLSMLLLCSQIGVVTGSFRTGFEHIFYAWGKRTSGGHQAFPSDITPSFHTSYTEILTTYVKGFYWSRMTYLHLLILFSLASAGILLRHRPRAEKAYLAATWFSLLAPLSWFTIFKAHAFIHPHMDFIVWQMPFVVLGFGLVGLAMAPPAEEQPR